MANPKQKFFEKTARILKRYGYRTSVDEESSFEGEDLWVLYVKSQEGEAGSGTFQAVIDGEQDYRGEFAVLLTNPDQQWEYPGLGDEEQALVLAEHIMQFDAGWYVDVSEVTPAAFKRWLKS